MWYRLSFGIRLRPSSRSFGSAIRSHLQSSWYSNAREDTRVVLYSFWIDSRGPRFCYRFWNCALPQFYVAIYYTVHLQFGDTIWYITTEIHLKYYMHVHMTQKFGTIIWNLSCLWFIPNLRMHLHNFLNRFSVIGDTR